MRTEEQIVYELLNIYHGGSVSNDNVVNERLMRSFLRKHRASKLYKYSDQGASITNEAFQYLGELTCERNESTGDYDVKIPALIDLRGYGIRLYKGDYDIPLIAKDAYRRSKKNIINKGFPKATMVANTLTIFPGIDESGCKTDSTSSKEIAVSTFITEIAEFNDNERIKIEVDAVLYDPDEAYAYDWTSDPYPCPSEIIDELTTSAAARDLNLMIRQFVDEDVNSKEDKVETGEGIR